MKYGFGIDLGGTTVKLAYFAENGEMIDKWEIPTDKSNDGSRLKIPTSRFLVSDAVIESFFEV